MSLDLSTSQLPVTKNNAIGTTLLEVIFPKGTRKITLQASVASWVQQASGADGGAVTAANTFPLQANAPYELDLAVADIAQNPVPSVFVATQSGSGTPYVQAQG